MSVLPVINIKDISHAIPLARALSDGGMTELEVTLRSDASLDAIYTIREHFPSLRVGAGTVLETSHAMAALDAGACFLVSPGFDDRLHEFSAEHGVDYIGGCATPSELQHAVKLGVSTVKFFPSELLGGVKALKLLSGAFSMLEFVPTGGITLENLGEYLSLKCVKACGGSFMAGAELIEKGRWDEITENCRYAIEIAKGVGR